MDAVIIEGSAKHQEAEPDVSSGSTGGKEQKRH
jgi:hypothetical protein